MSKQEELNKIAEEIAHCRECKQQTAGKSVPGEGNPDARVMFIGEAPGKQEAETGRPFIGKSGQLLREQIRDIGLSEEDVFITSVCKYLPLRGTPTPTQIAHGRPYLKQQIEIINPKVIVLLGSVACKGVLDVPVSIAREHGHVVKCEGRECFISYHPAAAIRFRKNLSFFKDDFAHLRDIVATL